MKEADINSAVKPWLPPKWDAEADVVVCGYGGAGAVAAISAYDAGAEVILIERKLVPGGNTVMSEGGMYACNTEQQKALGIKDSPEWMYKYLQAANKNRLDEEACRIFCEQSASAVKWVSDLGVNMPAKEGGWIVPGQVLEGNELAYTDIAPAVPRLNWCEGGGPAWWAAIKKAVESRAIKVMLKTTLKELVTGPQKEVLGIRAEDRSGGSIYIKARRGVILTTFGNFEKCPELIDVFAPTATGKQFVSMLATGATTGEDILAAMAIGAAINRINSDPFVGEDCVPVAVVSKGRGISAGANLQASHFLAVNKEGKRFANENSDDPRALGLTIVKQTDHTSYAIFGDDLVAKGPRFIALGFSEGLVKEMEAGVVKKSGTLAGLAEQLGIDPKALQTTVDNFNSNAARGVDPDFGRTINLTPFTTSNWYAFELTTNCQFRAGLRNNAKAQVLDVCGRVIPRLYVAGALDGASSHGMFKYTCGCHLTSLVIFGRIAGASAAALPAWS
jgi:fumarate reductase flavoprotein subunit